MLKYLYKGLNRSYKFLFFVTMVTIFLVSILDVVQGFLFMIFMNTALGINNYPLWLLMVIGVGFIIFFYIFSFLSSYLVSSLLKCIRGELVHDSLSKYLELEICEFLKNETESSMTNFINNEIENLVSNYYNYFFQLFGVPSFTVVMLQKLIIY